MKHITQVKADQYRYLATLAKNIESAISELVVATAKADIPELAKVNILNWIDRAETFRGLSYFLTPQTEWTGGDSSNPKNFRVNAPHIAE